MTDHRCRRCDEVFDPAVVYATFLADFAARVGFAHTGPRPGWVRHFCGEACRGADIAARNKVHIDRGAARRAAARRERK